MKDLIFPAVLIIVLCLGIYGGYRALNKEITNKEGKRIEARQMIDEAYKSGDKDQIIHALNNYIYILGEQK